MLRFRKIFFDLDGTLLNFQEAERGALQSALTGLALPYNEEILYQYHEINRRLWEQFELGLITKDALELWRFEELLRELEIAGNAEKINAAYKRALARGAETEPGAREICEYLSRICKLYVVTNGTGKVQRSRLANSGLNDYFQDIFVSEEIGSRKPEQEFFNRVFQRLHVSQVEKSEILIVGDTVSADIKGGLRAGISTCWYNPNKTKNYTSFTPHYEIRKLEELKDIVPAR